MHSCQGYFACHKNSAIALTNERSFERSSRKASSTDSAKVSKTSGLNHLMKNLHVEGVLIRLSSPTYHQLLAHRLT